MGDRAREMRSSPDLARDIDGVVSLAQPGSAQPWYATLQADWGFDHDEMARDFFRRDFMDVIRGRLDLYVALHGWLETKGMAPRLEGSLPSSLPQHPPPHRAVPSPPLPV